MDRECPLDRIVEGWSGSDRGTTRNPSPSTIQDSIIAYFYYAEHTTALFLHLLQMFQTSDFRLSVRDGIHKVATGTRM